MKRQRQRPDVTDDAAWQRYVKRRRLTPDEEQFLKDNLLAMDRTFFKFNPSAHQRERGLRLMLIEVLDIHVEIKPGGHALLRDVDANYRIEMQWAYDRDTDSPQLMSVQIVADEFLGPGALILAIDIYIAAFFLAWARGRKLEDFRRLPRRRPQSGQPLDPDFYRRVLAGYEELMGEGYKDPAAELARRMDANRSTVKSWLRRGRLYLGEPEGGKR